MAYLTGQVIRSYEIKENIGVGGFGVVYRALQASVGREVAIKVILPHFANRPEFVRRFETEAQLIARIEHPHIVPLYDYWREPEGAYLIMRYLRGGNLRGILKLGAWDVEHVATVLDQIASALDYAHRHGIIHRDVKPDNILLDEDGNAYLSDFGIAKLLHPGDGSSDEDGLSGSLGYISPEQARGEPITGLSDIYSLGICVYELLAGSHPFASDTATSTQDFRRIGEPVPSIAEKLPLLPSELSDVLQQATDPNPAFRFPNATAFARAFRIALTPERTAAARAVAVAAALASTETAINPYKGLRAFEEIDAQDFFGREALVTRLLEHMVLPFDAPDKIKQSEFTRFLVVVGPSGSGKSSVVKAGLIPALRRGTLPGSDAWLISQMNPAAVPFKELESALMQVATHPVKDLYQKLISASGGLAEVIPQLLSDDNSELLLVIDQFEEVFTQVASEAERLQFLKALYQAVTSPQARLRLIITLRADFYDRPLLYADFGRLVQQRTEVVLPLTPNEVAEAIIRPVERMGMTVERGLAMEIAGEVADQPGALPLLQYALTELFERREGNTLTRAAYHELGGVLGALTRRAEEMFVALSSAEKAAARTVFPRLVTLGEGAEDTRRRALRAELDSFSPQVSQVIDLYGRARLLSFDRDPITRSPTVEVAHEALIREWHTLRAWLSEDRESIRVQRHITLAAQAWLDNGRDRGDLYRGARLAQAREWAEAHLSELNPTERAFFEASLMEARREELERAEQQRRELDAAQKLANTEKARAEEQARAASRLRARGRVLIAAFSIALALLLVAVFLGFTTNQQRMIAEANFKNSEILRLVAEANTLLLSNSNIETAPLLSIASLKLGYSPEADSTLQRAMTYTYPAQKLIGHDGSVLTVAYAPDGKLIATGGSDNTVRFWDPQTGVELRHIENANTNSVEGVAFARDGKKILATGGDGVIRVYDLATLDLNLELSGHTQQVWSANFSPDGTRIVSGSYDQTVRMWDATTGATLFIVPLPSTTSGVLFAPDGKNFFVACDDGNGYLYDSGDGALVRSFIGHGLSVVVATFSRDGSQVITGSADKTARIWDVASGQELQRFTGHTEAVYAVAFTADQRYVLTGSYDRMAILWDVATGVPVRKFIGHSGSLYGAVFSPDDKWIVTASFDKTAWIWPSGISPNPRRLQHVSPVLAVAFSHDGRKILTGETNSLGHIWDAATGAELRTLTGHQYDIDSVDFSPDDKLAASASSDMTVRIWDVNSGRIVHLLQGHTAAVWIVRFSPDGRYLISGGDDATAILWEVASGKALRKFEYGATVYAAAFSPDGRTLIIGEDSGQGHIYDTSNWDERLVIATPLGSFYALAFTPDSKAVIGGGRGLWLFDATTGEQLRSYEGHTGGIFAIAISPDGQYLISGGEGGTARLWDLATGEQVRAFNGQQGLVYAAAFAPDSQSVLIGAADNTVMLWDIDYQKLIAYACTHITRDLTLDERDKYDVIDTTPVCAAK